MTPTAAHPTTFKARQALAVTVVSVLAGVVLGGAFCSQLGWADGRLLTNAAGLAGIVWLVAALIGVQVLVMGTGLSVDRLGMGILASSMARMMGALLIGIIVFFVLRPEGRTFWVTFLAAGMLALIAEAFWAIRTINASMAAASIARPVKDGAA